MPKLKHIALFKFKADCSAEDIARVWRIIEDLPKQIPGFLDLTWGTDASVEGLSDGFSHSFVAIFESVEARDLYLPHPVHQAAVAIIMPMLERVIVIDHEIA
ncbi:MAG: Dabb family protein [Armatimonadetes bacterium]|nr:Dabb family protein [Akkermansiaceae bacterium]